MFVSEYGTNSIGTKDWLQAAAQLTISAFTEENRSPLSEKAEVIFLGDSWNESLRPYRIFEPSVHSPLEQTLRYLWPPPPFTNVWSIHASESQKRILNRLLDSGCEKVARRLSDLIDILFEDDDVLVVESMEAVAEFFIENDPKYPGPAIVSDDDGYVGVQWKIPLDESHEEGDRTKGGILYLKFLSRNQVTFIGTLRNQGSEEVFRSSGSASLDELMNKIARFSERLDWR